MFVVIGVLLITHEHEKYPVAIMWHTISGALLIAVAFVQGVVTFLHALELPNDRATMLARLVHAQLFMISGVWMCFMGYLYIHSPYEPGSDGGFHTLLEQNGFISHSNTEAIFAYFSATCLLSTAMMLYIVWRDGAALQTQMSQEQKKSSYTNVTVGLCASHEP
eukprot:CAMPEP_0174730244 /NCGR_PEP_ID=MMETSP1094-20130205/55217_1 /TAXON_ID=156173 /ORGANISM="Chrysochromulina brevifilum, Strain UTEX LB 985" /LENGTH=163 /DNA_ID=CAMNT_0015932475 /DNA_START=179 /DNA_END=670 /DNA_ORIENTATION=+